MLMMLGQGGSMFGPTQLMLVMLGCEMSVVSVISGG